MAITKEKKAEILKELVDKFGRSKTVVFSDYRGLDVGSISDLRSKLRESGSEAKVAKKTLIKLAAKECDLGDINDDVMEGPVAVTFSYEDEIAGLKVLFNFSKDNENLKLLGGIVDGKVVGAEEIIALAKLPGREELYAKLLGSLNAPLSGFVGIGSNLVSGFVRVINAYKDTLPAEGAEPVEATEEAAAPEPTPEPPKEEEKPTSDDTAEAETEAVKTQDPESQEEGEKEEEKPADETAETEETPADEPEAPAEEEEKKEE